MISVDQLLRDTQNQAGNRLRLQSAPVVRAQGSPMLTQANAPSLSLDASAVDKVEKAAQPIKLQTNTDMLTVLQKELDAQTKQVMLFAKSMGLPVGDKQ